MMTQQQFEKTYMHKQNVMSFDEYVMMENKTAEIFENIFGGKTQEQINADFQTTHKYNASRFWSNE